MRRLLFVLILLGFPLLEMLILARLAEIAGWLVVVWVIGAIVAGFMLIKTERFSFLPRVVLALGSGRSLREALFSSGRTLIAGALLIFPGVISDILAIGLLLSSSRLKPVRPGSATRSGPVAKSVIEGEYRRED